MRMFLDVITKHFFVSHQLSNAITYSVYLWIFENTDIMITVSI